MRGGRHFTVEVTSDGQGLISHAGVALLAEVADRVGLTVALSRALAPMRERRSGHDPGRVVRDLAVMIADGGECVADLRGLRDQQALFGPVASDATAFRVIDRLAKDPDLSGALHAARAAARERVWERGGRPGRVIIDIDGTMIGAHSEKQGAAGNWRGGFGFYPLLAYLDGSREALAGMLRPGNAGSNTAVDHIQILERSIAQLPEAVACDSAQEIVMRTDSAGATHELLEFCQESEIRFLSGLELSEPVRAAILALPEAAWQPALRQDGSLREGAHVAELGGLDLSAWPAGSRVIVRRERPHPGAQLSFTDHDGHRFLATLTDLTGPAPELERLHRARASAEDRIRDGKQTGLGKLPFREFDLNQVWLELSLIAQDLLAWTATLTLPGELARCQPATLRYRLLHTAARLSFHARTARLHLQATWPWTAALAHAFARITALAAPG
jgi:hypothetical protein